MSRLRPRMLLIATSIALSSCSGGGSTGTLTTAPPTCPPGAGIYPLLHDPMTQPPAGSAGVATTIGAITVPAMDHVAGAPVQLFQKSGPFYGGTFVADGSGLTAPIPMLQPNTTYQAFAVGFPCGPDFDFGQFTTGAT